MVKTINDKISEALEDAIKNSVFRVDRVYVSLEGWTDFVNNLNGHRNTGYTSLSVLTPDGNVPIFISEYLTGKVFCIKFSNRHNGLETASIIARRRNAEMATIRPENSE